MSEQLDEALLKALMVTYATGQIIAACVENDPMSNAELRDKIKVVKEALSA